MKTKIYMMTVILVMNIPLLYAGDPLVPVTKAGSKPNDVSFSVAYLAPVTPREATFTDHGTVSPSLIRHISSITLTDVIYDFINEQAFIPESGSFFLMRLAPVTPTEAGFEDLDIETVKTTVNLVPVTPATAEFNE